MGRLGQHLEVARGILLLAEDGAAELPDGIVDAGDERELRTTALEPVVLRAIRLEQHAGPRHPLPPAAVPWPSPGLRRGSAIRGEHPQQRLGRDREIGLLLRERLGEVGGVEAGIRRVGQLEQAGPLRLVDAVDRRPAPVAVDERGGAIATESLDEPAHLPGREVEEDRGLSERELAGQQVGEDGEASLRRSVQRDRLPRVHGSESDKVAVPLAVTFSLSRDTRRATDLT